MKHCTTQLLVIASVSFVNSTAHAAMITAVSGAIQQLNVAPPSVVQGARESNLNGIVFLESRFNSVLGVGIDPIAGGPGPGFLSGLVDSHYIHFDVVGTPPLPPVAFNASVTFSTPILGVALIDGTLIATDFLGAPGTTYPGAGNFRGITNTPPNFNEGVDSVFIDLGGTRINFAPASVAVQTDGLRVLTGSIFPPPPVPEPSGFLLAAVGALCLVVSRKSWSTGRNVRCH